MSRRINLSRIHAINWFGYNDVIDVHGNLLIAGVTGSGKSVLMDLIQLVLVGDQKSKYNQSATGAASTRTLKSYCLGDTKQDIDGTPQYMREKGAITFVALEFRWPDRKRVETWGLFIEFDSAAQNQPNRKNGFFIPASLSKSDWLHEDRTPLDFASFRRMVKESKGSVFETMDSYRREMGIPTHLNFDRGTLDYLLPAAMSFTFLRSFNDFCRQYILPAGEVDIQPVKESFQAFRSFEHELSVLRDQLIRLEMIHSTDQQRADAERDRTVFQYVEAEFRREAALEAVEDLGKRVAKLEADLAEDNRRLALLDKQISGDGATLDSLKAALTASEEGKLFLHLRGRNKILAGDIARLKEIGRSVEEAVKARLRQADKWLVQARELPVKPEEAALRAVEQAVLKLKETSGDQLRERIRQLAQSAQTLSSTVRSAAAALFNEETELDRERQRLNALIGALRLGVVPEASVLLNALNHQLPGRGGENSARALRELCEVTDEAWRPAVEVAFTRKFAVVVDEKDFDKAEQIYHGLKSDAPRESLINSAQAVQLNSKVNPGSLAEMLETNHPVAKAIVAHAFGDLMCVENAGDLRKHARAILQDGFMYQRPFVERRAHYQNNPCIGKRGLEKQREFLQAQLDDCVTAGKVLASKVNAAREFLELARGSRLDSESIHDDLAEVARLQEKEAELAANIEQMRHIRDLGIEEKENEIALVEKRLADAAHERDGLIGSYKQQQLVGLRKELQGAGEKAQVAGDRFSRIQAEGPDITLHLARRDEVRAEALAERPVKELAADLCRERFHHADKEADRLRQELVGFRRELALAHTAFVEFDPESVSNGAYTARLEKIRAGDIPGYEAKARSEKTNWQHLFRTQVLSKLHAALFEVENLLAVLNQELRSPIGHNTYRLTRRPNPDQEYQVYRSLVDASAAAREDDLFFESMDADLRRTVEEIFRKLIEQPESKEALGFLDYRNYHDYDMEVTDTRSPDARPTSVDRHSGKFSGGENQSPYFVAILACYLRAYHRYEKRRKDPSLALVPIDEAFSKLSGERIRDCISALKTLDLQGVFSMSSGNIPYAMDMCDQIVTVMKKERTAGRRQHIRNVPVVMTREEAIARYGGRMWSQVLRYLAKRYSGTKAARTGVAIRDFLIDYEELLRESGCGEGEPRMCAERDLAEAGDTGLLTVERHKRTRLPMTVRFSPAKEEELYMRVDEAAPSRRRDELSSIFRSAALAETPPRWQAGWSAFCIELATASATGGSVQPFDRGDPVSTREILDLLPRILAWEGDSLMRFASGLLCGDSKRIEQLQRKLETCLDRITSGKVKLLSDLGITQNERSCLLHGPMRMEFDTGMLDLAPLIGPARIDRRDIEHAKIATDSARCLTVENATMLHELCKLRSGVILASSGSEGGFAHSAIIALLKALPDTVECWHFGDSDPKGFDILRDLRERSGRRIQSMHMHFRENPRSPKLDAGDRSDIDRLLISNFVTEEEKNQLRAMASFKHLGDFEQESLGIPNRGWPFYSIEKVGGNSGT